MNLLAFDWETTGNDPKTCRGVQFGALWAESGGGDVHVVADTLCDPQCEISPDAQKVHGISADQLIGKRPDHDIAQQVCRALAEQQEPLILLGHNSVVFDQPLTTRLSRMGGFERGLEGYPHLDTYQIAQRVYPDAPSHRLSVDDGTVQGLVQSLALSSGKAHDAVGDCWMVMRLLEKVCKDLEATVEEVLAWMSVPYIFPTCTYKKFRGKAWGTEVPREYAVWICNKFTDPSPDLIATMEHHYGLKFKSVGRGATQGQG